MKVTSKCIMLLCQQFHSLHPSFDRGSFHNWLCFSWFMKMYCFIFVVCICLCSVYGLGFTVIRDYKLETRGAGLAHSVLGFLFFFFY